jgi:hypothetical protein
MVKGTAQSMAFVNITMNLWGSIRSGKFLDQFNLYQFLKKDSARS